MVECYYQDTENIELLNIRLQYAKECYDRQVQDFAGIETRASFLLILFVPILSILIETGKNLTFSASGILHIVLLALATAGFIVCSLFIIRTITTNKAKKILGTDLVSLEFHGGFTVYFENLCSTDKNKEKEKHKYSLIVATEAYNRFEQLNSKAFQHKCDTFEAACWITFVDLILSILTIFI